MVRVLPCHHFRSQRIGRCEEAVSVALADDVVIVALEHLINIYASESISNLAEWFNKKRSKISFGKGSLGQTFRYDRLQPSSPPKIAITGANPKLSPSSSETLKLVHSFSPVDLIVSVSYNERGHYIQCLEHRENSGSIFQVRMYFHWDRPSKGKAMKARIAGLVSPTVGDFDGNSFLMVELPPEPLFAIIATASCQLTGNIATLSQDARVNIYAFHLKEVIGRSKAPSYIDFDLVLTLQFTDSCPSRIIFALNHVGIFGSDEVRVVRIKTISDGHGSSGTAVKRNGPQVTAGRKSEPCDEDTGVLIFNPKTSHKLTLSLIEKENLKKKQAAGFLEELQNEIFINRTIITPASKANENLDVEDILRLKSEISPSTTDIVHLSLHPERLYYVIGGTLCYVGMETELLIYHFSEVGNSVPVRVTKCPFTGPLHRILFDNSFIHALTDAGIQTYSSRGFSEALKDIEGFQPLNNDCPLVGESPCVLGIQLFPNIKFMEGNDHCLCILSAPPGTELSTSTNELWTIYLLELPSTDQFYDDIMRAAEESSPDIHLTLLGEIHLYLRGLMNRRPEDEEILKEKYRQTTRLLGLEFFRKWTLEQPEEDDLLNKGIAFLQLSHTEVKFFFKQENQDVTRDPQLIAGISKFLRLSLPMSSGQEFPPSLSKAVVEFLVANSTKDLIKVTLETPWIREVQGQRILTSLRTISDRDWKRDLALILTIVAVLGRDNEAIEEVRKILKTSTSPQDQCHFFKCIKWSWILEKRKGKLRLSDLAIVLAMTSCTDVHINVVVSSIEGKEVGLDDVILVFHQGVNLNADMAVKETLTRSLRRILELFFVHKMNASIEREEEIRGLHLLISSYLPNILQHQGRNIFPTTIEAESKPEELFSKVPSWINILIDDGPQIPTLLAKEHFYALASLLLSPLGNTKGAKDVVLRSITSSQSDSPLSFPLCLLAESRNVTLSLLIEKRPDLVLLYAKDTFGDLVDGWKSLLFKLKEKIGLKPPNQEVIETLTESVYLHLANSLSPSVLEEVLDKGGDRFLDISKRIDMANSFADRVASMSKAFLSRPS